MFQVRTDLAVEERERFEEENVEVKGVRIEESGKKGDMLVTKVVIETENGARAMGKPRGTYITLEAPDMAEQDENYHREVSKELAKILCDLLPKQSGENSVLVIGLGNREVTPDALGPNVVDNLQITRHIMKEYGPYAFGKEKMTQISGIVPGVMAQTGMESVEVAQGVVKQTSPDCVVVVDALAARSTKRLNRTIQITDTGINPGSGVGNHRHAINEKSMGIPVVAIGIPTVVDAATIVSDTMNNLISAMSQAEQLKNIGRTLSTFDDTEKYELVRELLSPQLYSMFVTPKDIDESIKRLSYTISEGLNLAFTAR